MTEERNAIVAFLRTVAGWYKADQPTIDSDGGESYGDLYETLTAVTDDIEEMHPETVPHAE